MRVLVTGVTGFVGRHLTAELAAHGHEVCGFDLGASPADLPLAAFSGGDILDPRALRAAVEGHTPDACVHLAGSAFVPDGRAAPERVLDVNLMGTVRLLEAFRDLRPTARVLTVSSAHVYGSRARPAPIAEDDPLEPDSFYALSKAGADRATRLYAAQYGMHAMVARPYNHIGPGQSPLFVVAAFARQVRAIRDGAAPVMRVGNLESRRDFTDVRDVARAYRLLLERGRPGHAYNIASDRLTRVGDILVRLCELAGVKPSIERDTALYRPDTTAPRLDIRRIVADTGWTPAVSLDQTLRDIIAAP